MTKPTSKVIQISSTQCPDGLPIRTALCNDGSVWELYRGQWERVLEPHQSAQPSIPMPGNRWVGAIDEIEILEIYYLEGRGVQVSFRVNDDKREYLPLRQFQEFIKSFKPKPSDND